MAPARIFWPTPFCLEETAVAENLVDLHMLLFHQDIKADFQGAKGSKQVDSHKVCQIEFRIRSTCEDRTALVEAGYVLAGEVVVGKESAAVCVALQGFVVQLAEQIIRADSMPKVCANSRKRLTHAFRSEVQFWQCTMATG